MLHVQLDAIEDLSEEAETDRCIELLLNLTLLLVVLLGKVVQALIPLGLPLSAQLPGLFTIQLLLNFAFFLELLLLVTNPFVHLCDVLQRVPAIIPLVDVPCVVLRRPVASIVSN